MENQLAVFHFKESEVRVIRDNQGEPWWVTGEVAAILGIDNPRTITERLDEDEVGFTDLIDNMGRSQRTSIISESGIYAAIVRSNKPAAKDFQRWVRKEVLPSIRKTGGYFISIPKTLPEALRLYADEVEKREQVEAQLALAAPKIEFFDTITDCKDSTDMGRVAKVLDMGIGRNNLFEFLREKKILMGNNVPYQQYVDSGYFRVIVSTYNKPDGSVHASTKTLVYPKGMDYIRKVLVGAGYSST